MQSYSSLHSHSHYSKDGISSIKDWVIGAKKKGLYGLAITDHGDCSSLLELYTVGKKEKFPVTMGCEIYLIEDFENNNQDKKYYHLTVLIKNFKGYQNLCKLSTIAFQRDGHFYNAPRVSFAELFNHKEGLVICSGCLAGPLCWNIVRNTGVEEDYVKEFHNQFKDDYYIEIQPSIVIDKEGEPNKQEVVNRRLIELSKIYQIPLVITPDAHIIDESHKVLQDIKLNSKSNKKWDFDQSHFLFTPDELYQKVNKEHGYMAEYVNEAMINSNKIIDKTQFDMPEFESLLPNVDIRSHELYEEGDTQDSLFMKIISNNGRINLSDPKQFDILKYEYNTLFNNGVVNFLPYFLLLEDVVRWCGKNNVTVGPGRGSASGSLIAYGLKITHLDPIQYQLSFDRFINKGRIVKGTYPDIDMDFSDPHIVKRYISEKYGEDHVALMGTIQTLKVKGALKDVLGLLRPDMSFEDKNELTASIPQSQPGENEVEFFKNHLTNDPKLAKFLKDNMDVYEAVFNLLGQCRQKGAHPCIDKNALVDNAGKVSKLRDASYLANKKISTWSTGEKDTVILTFNNGVSIVSTPDHRFFDQYNKEIQAKDLLGQYVPYKKFSSVSGDIKEDLDLCFFAGWMLADGTFNKYSNSIYFTPQKDSLAKDRVINYFIRNNISWWLDNRKDKVLFGKDFSKKWFYSNQLVVERRLPDFFWELTLECQQEYIKGLFSANGYVLNNVNRVGIKLTSKLLISDICLWLNSIGIKTHATINKSTNFIIRNKKCQNKDSVSIVLVLSDSYKKIEENISFQQLYKQDRLLEIINYFKKPNKFRTKNRVDYSITKCIGVEKYKKIEVYDFNEPIDHNGFVTGLLVHNCGLVVSSKKLVDIMPLWYNNGEWVTQYTADWCKKAGVVKYDFLGLNTLKDISGCLKLIKKNHGIEIDPYSISWDDKKTLDAFSKANTDTVFQFHTHVAKGILNKMNFVSGLEDLAAITALGRPGPMDVGMDAKFIARKNGTEPIEYPHSSLEGILKDTYGIMVYQEQVMLSVQNLGGFSLEESDEVRRAMGSKNKELLNSYKNRFIDYAINNFSDIDNKKANSIWDQIESFARYGFNKSHSVAYAMIGYICQYLRQYYPLEWYCSVFSNGSNEDQKNLYPLIKDLMVLPDINLSKDLFYIKDNKIVMSLSFIHGLGDRSVENIISNQPYSSFEDFWNKIDRRCVKKDVVINLIFADAFKSIEPDKSTNQLLDYYFGVLSKLRKVNRNKFSEYDNLNQIQTLQKRFEVLPIGDLDFADLFKDIVEGEVVSFNDLLNYKTQGHTVSIVGKIEDIKLKTTKKGNKMAFVTFENQNKKVRVTVWPGDWNHVSTVIKKEQICQVWGDINIWNGSVSLVMKQIKIF